jgi:glycerol-1-phosphate dehydrogenase [NAD(P)+]
MDMLSTLVEQLQTKVFYNEHGCVDRVAEAVAQVNTERRPPLIICDETTRSVAGQRVFNQMEKQGLTPKMLELDRSYGDPIPADYPIVTLIRDAIMKDRCFPVAVGSGTINDLVKRASFEAEVQYVCVPTASSMDGYASSGAALVKEGLKLTLACPPPVGIVADPAILETAPPAMTSAGYGDMFAKLAAGIDWHIADRLGLEKVDAQVWSIVQDDLKLWVADPDKLFEPGSATFATLFKGLTYSGFAMQIYQDSRPASGAEHTISHIWEMEHLSYGDRPVSHGFKVSLGTVITVLLMERLFGGECALGETDEIVAKRPSLEERIAEVKHYFPSEPLQSTIIDICRAKWASDEELTLRIDTFKAHFAELAALFFDRLGSSEHVRSELKKAGCPTSLSDLGIDRSRLLPTLVRAQMIRKRYTSLDLLYELGLYEACIGELAV